MAALLIECPVSTQHFAAIGELLQYPSPQLKACAGRAQALVAEVSPEVAELLTQFASETADWTLDAAREHLDGGLAVGHRGAGTGRAVAIVAMTPMSARSTTRRWPSGLLIRGNCRPGGG